MYLGDAKSKIKRDLGNLQRLHRPNRGFLPRVWYGMRRGFIFLREGVRVAARVKYGIPL